MRDKPNGIHYSPIFNRGKQSSLMGNAYVCVCVEEGL